MGRIMLFKSLKVKFCCGGKYKFIIVNLKLSEISTARTAIFDCMWIYLWGTFFLIDTAIPCLFFCIMWEIKKIALKLPWDGC